MKLFNNHSALTRSALAVKRARGEKIGNIQYGFKEDAGKIIPDDYEQETIRIASELRANGWTLAAIGKLLGQFGRLNRKGRPFPASSIYEILRNASKRAA